MGKTDSNFPSFAQGEKRWKGLNHIFTSITPLYSEFVPSWEESMSLVKKRYGGLGSKYWISSLCSYTGHEHLSAVSGQWLNWKRQQRWLQNEGDALITVSKGVFSLVPSSQRIYSRECLCVVAVLIHPFVGGCSGDVESWQGCTVPRETFLLPSFARNVKTYEMTWVCSGIERNLGYGFSINCFSSVP